MGVDTLSVLEILGDFYISNPIPIDLMMVDQKNYCLQKVSSNVYVNLFLVLPAVTEEDNNLA